MNTENNKIIAEFMGLSYSEKYMFEGWYKNHEHNERVYELNYHSDWNWLMEVIEKINILGYEVLIGRISCQINNILEREKPIAGMVCGDISKKIEITYDAVVQFIKWYNEQKA